MGLEVRGWSRLVPMDLGIEVVEHHHLVIPGDQLVDRVRADEAGTSSYQDPHASLLTLDKRGAPRRGGQPAARTSRTSASCSVPVPLPLPLPLPFPFPLPLPSTRTATSGGVPSATRAGDTTSGPGTRRTAKLTSATSTPRARAMA